LASESSAAASPMSIRPLSGSRRLINLSIPSKHNACGWLASRKHRSKHNLTLTRGLVSLATMVSEPASPLLAVGFRRAGNSYLFYIGCWRWRVAPSLFLN
jgi:hypothetical protein